MLKYYYFILIICTLSFMQSCLVKYGDYTKSSFTPTTEKEYKNVSGQIDVYFEGTEIAKEYIQIGFVEVVGEEYSSNEKLIAYLKFEAYKKGADALIGVKKMFKDREEGYLFDTENTEIYAAPIFSGIAIKYTGKDSLTTDSLHIKIDDPEFQKLVEEDKDKSSTKTGTEFIMSFVVLIIVVVAVLIKNN